MLVRLQKFLAEAGVASRRASEQIIVAGRVAVNGAIDWETEIFVTTLIGIWAPAAFIGVLAACRARAVWPERYPALIAS